MENTLPYNQLTTGYYEVWSKGPGGEYKLFGVVNCSVPTGVAQEAFTTKWIFTKPREGTDPVGGPMLHKARFKVIEDWRDLAPLYMDLEPTKYGKGFLSGLC
jgi:hypothetical protein